MRKYCIFRCCYKTKFEYLLDKKIYSTHNIECPLCLEDLSCHDCIKLYDCEHVFHEKCIVDYLHILKKNNRLNYFCPYCNSDQTAFYKYIMKAHNI